MSVHSSTPVTAAEARARLIKRSDMVACALAFIDCKMPGSERKENYSLVGPGVTQSRDQVVNLTEAHGFSLGVAAMPPGTVNNLHVHFTAEVFMIQRGNWTFRWGTEGENTVAGGPGDVVSVPTWIFRGFSNTGEEDGWIFTALGGDDTGGIIWHPSILENAAQYGMFLTKDNMLVDTAAGTPQPAPDALMAPLNPEQMTQLPHYTPEQMARRVVKAKDRAWSAAALLSAGLPLHQTELAPIIGHGMTEERAHAAPIGNAHGFSVEWLRIPSGNATGRHALDEKQVIIVFSGELEVTLNGPGAEVPVQVATGECFSAPPGAWRSLAAAGNAPVEAALVTAGDARKWIHWAPEIVQAALAAGTVLDHDGHVAPLALMPPPTRTAVTTRMMHAAE
ncbi:MAG: cupin domain-containing protein [Acetobacteraceae bacterium]|nr:cupin domain-containing protein [Acetobacteraceae bacterium]